VQPASLLLLNGDHIEGTLPDWAVIPRDPIQDMLKSTLEVQDPLYRHPIGDLSQLS